MVCTSGPTATDLKASGVTLLDTVRAVMCSQMEMYTWASIGTVSQRVSGSTGGPTATSTAASSSRVKSRAKVFGRNQWKSKAK